MRKVPALGVAVALVFVGGVAAQQSSHLLGEKFDAATMKALPAGGYALLPAEMRHYAMAKTAAEIQVHGMGPFALTYVNPADDPSKRAAK